MAATSLLHHITTEEPPSYIKPDPNRITSAPGKSLTASTTKQTPHSLDCASRNPHCQALGIRINHGYRVRDDAGQAGLVIGDTANADNWSGVYSAEWIECKPEGQAVHSLDDLSNCRTVERFDATDACVVAIASESYWQG